MADYIRPTPRNPILGLLADALTGGVDWMRDPRRTQQMQGLGGLLAETGIPATMERLSYGEPLTKGKGMTTRLRPEAEAALMTLGPEAVPIGRGAMAAVRATKGLPVGASIKQLNLSEGIFKPELTMQEMLRVKDIPTVQRMQRSMDLVGEKNFKGMVEDIFKKYKPTDQDQEAMLVEAVTLDILGRANRNPELLRGLPGLKTPAPQEEALRLAQQRAALPVSEGGLGLPPNNTPMDRARAMGFDTDVYHGRKGDFQNFDTSFAGMSTGTKGVARKAIDATNDPSVASDYALNSRPPEFFQISDLLRKLEKVKKKLNTDPAAGDEFMQLSKRIREIEEANPLARAPFSVLVERAKEQANVMPLLVRGKNLAVADSGKWNQSVRRDALTQAAQQGFDGVVFKSVPDVLTAFKDPATYTHDTYAILNPSVVRSRFAAFDPTRRNEPDLLAGALPFTALLDEENRALLEERLGGLLGR